MFMLHGEKIIFLILWVKHNALVNLISLLLFPLWYDY